MKPPYNYYETSDEYNILMNHKGFRNLLYAIVLIILLSWATIVVHKTYNLKEDGNIRNDSITVQG